MSDESKQPELNKPDEELIQPTYVRRPGPVGYVDLAVVNFTYYGFKISFATSVHTSPEPTLEEFGSVGMSPEHAKDLHRLLGEQLKLYENRWGPVRAKIKDQDAGGGTTGRLDRGDSKPNKE